MVCPVTVVWTCAQLFTLWQWCIKVLHFVPCHLSHFLYVLPSVLEENNHPVTAPWSSWRTISDARVIPRLSVYQNIVSHILVFTNELEFGTDFMCLLDEPSGGPCVHSVFAAIDVHRHYFDFIWRHSITATHFLGPKKVWGLPTWRCLKIAPSLGLYARIIQFISFWGHFLTNL